MRKLRSLSRQEYLIIRGNLGNGKSWLAIDACLDYSVIRAMDYHVFWVNVSKCDTPEAILEQMQFLKIMVDTGRICDSFKLTEFESIELKIIGLKKFFQNLFQNDKYKNALLVLCNVKNKQVLEAFDFHCKTLVTTRNESCFDDIPRNLKEFVVIDKGLTEDESLEFFNKLGVSDSKNYQSLVRTIHRLSKGDPMIISLISNNIISLRNPEARLKTFIGQLKRNELNDSQLHPTIEESLKILPEDERIAYQQLVVFPEYSYVPISVLQQYWRKKEFETEDLVNKFYRYSLLAVNYYDEEITVVSMHYLYRSYLLRLYSVEEKREFHRNFIESYHIESALELRSEPDLPNDRYIHFYIGYHLKEAQYFHLFPRLFLDFGFLEQKLRYTLLPNTIGDLTIFRQEIGGSDSAKLRLLDELLIFLPSIEEMIYQSNDTSLLQYCLTSTKRIAEEAKRQAAQFRNRVWLNDIDHSHKRRQIVQLHGKPVQLNFHDPDAIVVALDDHSILLTDLSPSYSVEPTLFQGHNKKIKHISTFGNYILSLDTDGIMFIWSLRDTPVQIYRSEDKSNDPQMTTGNRHRRVLQNNYDVRNVNYRKSVQRLESTVLNPITCYKICEKNQKIKLYCATKNGKIVSYEWCESQEKFIANLTQMDVMFYSNVDKIQCLHFIPEKYLMTLTQDGHFSVFDLATSSKMGLTKEWRPVRNPVAIYQNEIKPNLIYCVFREKIIKINIEKFLQAFIMMEPFQEIYSVEANHNAAITCSAISDDGKYLILGTKKGIIVFDCENEMEVLRNSIGDRISCIDICTCGDEIFKYIIISGAENGQNVGNIYVLEVNKRNYDLVTWGSSKTSSLSDENLSYGDHRSNNEWLIGGKLFEVIPSNSAEPIIYAVDSQNQIQLFSAQNKFTASHFVTQEYPSPIKVTASYKDDFYFGCQDGRLFKLGEAMPVLELTTPIVFLKEINDCLVVGTQFSFHFLNSDVLEQNGLVFECYSLSENVVLVVLEDCNVMSIDLSCGSIFPQIIPSRKKQSITITGCDFKSDLLALVDSDEKIKLLSLGKEVGNEVKSLLQEIAVHENHITAIALSDDASVLAVGMERGEIDVSLGFDL